ncbi:MAG: hypothetical protein M3014_02355, partial [Chloroflexota bacterium]|nr:hypothetical protein [Chloroflexota bacterium]
YIVAGFLQDLTGPIVSATIPTPEQYNFQVAWSDLFRNPVFTSAAVPLVITLLIYLVTKAWKRPKNYLPSGLVLTARFFIVASLGIIFPLPTLFEGWLRFAAAIFTVYVLMGLWIILPHIVPGYWDSGVFSNTATVDGQTVRLAPPAVVLLGKALAVAWFLSQFAVMYQQVLYPQLPQQLGGGSLIPTQVLLEATFPKSPLTDPIAKVYVVDRTASDTIFQVSSSQNISPTIIQISNSDVKQLLFKPR